MTSEINSRILVGHGYLTVIADPDTRNRAWNIIVDHLAKGTCRLDRIDDTAFKITPNLGFDLAGCLNIATVALFAAQA
jgi:hypothetical protein